MATQTTNVELPDEIHRRLKTMAAATRRPFEAVLVQTLRGNLPLSQDDLPPTQRDLATTLASLGDEALWAVARESISGRNWRRHRHLLRKAEADTLTPTDQEELAALRDATARLVTRRLVAPALLTWGGPTRSRRFPNSWHAASRLPCAATSRSGTATHRGSPDPASRMSPPQAEVLRRPEQLRPARDQVQALAELLEPFRLADRPERRQRRGVRRAEARRPE
jgi:hypothetical protein